MGLSGQLFTLNSAAIIALVNANGGRISAESALLAWVDFHATH